jgi:hypothetical protein
MLRRSCDHFFEYNAILTYETAVVNDIECEFLEPERRVNNKQVKLYLTDISNPDEGNTVGLRKGVTRMSGRCMFPDVLPSEIKPNRRYSISVYLTETNMVKGECYLLPTAISKMGLTPVFGEYVLLEVEWEK